MKYEIDIDLGQFSAEWEVIAIRVATQQDAFVTSGGVVSEPCKGGSFRTIYNEPRIIVRRRWKWPEWLTAEWIFCNCHETWFATNSDPIQVNTGFQSVNAVAITTNNYFQFTPPHCTDWTQSKRRNPNAKATT